MSLDLCAALSWVSMDAFNESDRAVINSLKTELVHARGRIATLFKEARGSASLGITSSQVALSGGAIATIPCPEALLTGASMILGGAFGTLSRLTSAREMTLQHRKTVKRLVDLECELRQVLGHAMAGDICLRAYLEEEAGILYAEMS